MNKETMELLERILGPEREEEGPRLSREGARELYEDMRELMFFDYYHKDRDESLVERILQRAESRYESLPEEEGGKPPFRKFLEGIPSVRESLEKDVEAIYEGDPASHGKAEIVLAYPGFIAISAYRIAHHLLGLGFPFAARVISEYAHSRTGIDIHPGARIAPGLCIDHGTGIVIGETSEIGEGCRIYQGVTIGALSLRKGRLLAGEKRHPTLEARVTVYAGASILGGGTVIGHDSIIGSNAFILESVPPNSLVRAKPFDIDLLHKE